ncbi:MAG: hypothetical protein WA749_13550, partial [Gelidibacter sp.]
MSQHKFYIVAFIVLTTSILFSQNSVNQDVDIINMRIQNYITQSGFETERGDYYNAKENLEKALKLANQIDDKKKQGSIYTKIAKVQFIVEEPE